MTQISALLGFSAPSAFSRWYKHQFGMNARDFKSTREKKLS
jgi:AraC-like DNA-binding protein